MSFSGTLYKPEEFKDMNIDFLFSYGRVTFWNGSFSKTMLFPARFFPNPNSKMTADCCVLTQVLYNIFPSRHFDAFIGITQKKRLNLSFDCKTAIYSLKHPWIKFWLRWLYFNVNWLFAREHTSQQPIT